MTPGPTSATDWNAAWQAARERSGRRTSRDGWDWRAPSFAQASSRSGYVERMLELMAPEPASTVLDVGCGSGALAAPLAHRVRSVTALDFSPRMLELLQGRCAAEGLGNVTPVLGSWEDEWAELGIGPHDVALASRSLSVQDLRAALLKLDRIARKRVFVTAPVGAGPVDQRVLAAVGRSSPAGPDYVYPLHVLEELGIPARLTIVPVADTRQYANLDDAVERSLWMVPEATPAELARLRGWLEQELRPGPEGLELATPWTVSWAVLSWSTVRARPSGW